MRHACVLVCLCMYFQCAFECNDKKYFKKVQQLTIHVPCKLSFVVLDMSSLIVLMLPRRQWLPWMDNNLMVVSWNLTLPSHGAPLPEVEVVEEEVLGVEEEVAEVVEGVSWFTSGYELHTTNTKRCQTILHSVRTERWNLHKRDKRFILMTTPVLRMFL